MQCTADPCYGQLQHMGGENQEDFGCSNWFDRNFRSHDCLASKYIGFHTHVRVRKDWYYLAQYNLPFRWINSSNYRWYALRGDPGSNETRLEGLKLRVETHLGDVRHWYEPDMDGRTNQHLALRDKECEQEHLFTVPYVALPANGDFKEQFAILRDRVMREWLRSRGMPTAVNPLYEIQVDASFPAREEAGIRIAPLTDISRFYEELIGFISPSTPQQVQVSSLRPSRRIRLNPSPIALTPPLDTSDDAIRQLVSSALDKNSTNDAMEVCRRLDQINRQKHSDKYQ